ncbi:MAG: hypothetical protein EOP06_20190 [Proteobacteria bacterium]|nr:MAG: hypothetical protein EOP06_20190 [Pseudomonadota bacterium]
MLAFAWMIVFAILLVPPSLILFLPWRWFRIVIPLGALVCAAFVAFIMFDSNRHNYGPGGFLIFGLTGLVFMISFAALALRLVIFVVRCTLAERS